MGSPAIEESINAASRRAAECGVYVSNIFAKLQVADRAQAIIRAREAGMG